MYDCAIVQNTKIYTWGEWSFKSKLCILEVFSLRGRGSVTDRILKIPLSLNHDQVLHVPVIQTFILILLWRDFADVIIVPKQLTIKYYYQSKPDLIIWTFWKQRVFSWWSQKETEKNDLMDMTDSTCLCWLWIWRGSCDKGCG